MGIGLSLALCGSIFPTRNWSVALGQWSGIVQPLGADLHAELLNLVPVIERITPPSATVAVAHAGTLPYYVDRRYVDLLGKCDPVVSRKPMHRNLMTPNPILEFFPGHLKWDYGYSLGQLKPDFIVTQWGKTFHDASPHLIGHYVKLSQHGRMEIWKKLSQDSRQNASSPKLDNPPNPLSPIPVSWPDMPR
jgi:hypothetical protein